MKKRHRRLTPRQHGPSQRRLRLEDLEHRLLLASDIILGPGTNEPRNEVFAEIRIDEIENAEVSPANRIKNNSIATAESVPLGFDDGEYAAIDLRGELIRPNSVGGGFSSERNPPNNPPRDDGSILLANLVNAAAGIPIAMAGTLGDSASGFNQGTAGQLGGDGDYYWLREVEVGEVITGHVATGTSAVLILYDEFGQVLMTSNTNANAFIAHQVEEEGDYFFAVVPYGNDPAIFDTPLNPFDASTVQGGPGGTYTVTIGVNAVDMDYYALELNAGDILGMNSIGAANLLTLYSPDGELLIASEQDFANLVSPASSPMPRGDTASFGYVIDSPGTYYLATNGFNWSKYVLEMRLFRPSIESAPEGTTQILFLDFDGAQLNPQVLPGGTADLRELSPLSRFMGRWGLRDESELIDRIIAVVGENFNEDMKRVNPDAHVEIRNSRDHADPFGQPYVSRVIVGGTAGESTITGLLGIANSVDVGNLDMEETAIVMLDLLSGPRSSPLSLNHYPVAPGVSKTDLVATGLGNIISHEAAHFFGAYHTETSNSISNIIDTGDGISIASSYLGVGDDFIWGTQDDVDIDFSSDEFAFSEAFVGFQNTLAMLANVLVTGKGKGGGAGDPTPVGVSLSGTVFHDRNGNGFRAADEEGIAGARVYVDLDNDRQFDIDEPSALSGATGTYQLTAPRTSTSLRVLVVPPQQLTFPTGGGHVVDPANPPTGALDFGLFTRLGNNAGTDFGDAPASYGIASHAIVSGFRLGSAVDGEAGPIANDSEDNGISLSELVIGEPASGTATVVTSGQSPGVLQGWIDFNRDGVFATSERIVRDLLAGEGSKTFSFNVPRDAQPGASYARFRYGYERGIGPAGSAIAGEVEDYPVQIKREGGTPPPQPVDAVNDVRNVAQGSSIIIDVLANDKGAGLSIFDVGNPSQGGAAVSVGQTIRYTPLASFFGTETFTYTVTDGVTSDTAVVSVDVEEAGGGGTDKLIRLRLQTVDGNSEPISQIVAGQAFELQVFTQDLRPGGIGVFSAYLDVSFDPALASLAGDVTFSDTYTAGRFVDVSMPGLLNEVGAFAGISNDLGSDELLLYSVAMTATRAGDLVFTSDPADVLPAHEVLLGDILQSIPASSIEYTSTTLTVNPVVAAAAFTNPRNPLDVNNDGAVSPSDALVVINEINLNGTRALSSGVAPVSQVFIDVNGDMHLSSIDALMVINHLNKQSSFAQAAAADTAVGEPMDVARPDRNLRAAAIAAAIDSALDDADDGDEMEDILDQIGHDLVA